MDIFLASSQNRNLEHLSSDRLNVNEPCLKCKILKGWGFSMRNERYLGILKKTINFSVQCNVASCHQRLCMGSIYGGQMNSLEDMEKCYLLYD